jgi:stage II sporulation protein D
MCQWGAMEMARRGYSFEEILKHYYRGIRIEKWY